MSVYTVQTSNQLLIDKVKKREPVSFEWMQFNAANRYDAIEASFHRFAVVSMLTINGSQFCIGHQSHLPCLQL